MAAETTPTTLLDLPPEILELIARSAPLDFRSLCSAASTCKAFRAAFVDDGVWRAAAERRWPGLPALLHATPPRWFSRDGGLWRRRAARLLSGAPFKVQVLNREMDSADDEDFSLSAYDAEARLEVSVSRRRGGDGGGVAAAATEEAASSSSSSSADAALPPLSPRPAPHHSRRAPDATAAAQQPALPLAAPPKPHEQHPQPPQAPPPPHASSPPPPSAPPAPPPVSAPARPSTCPTASLPTTATEQLLLFRVSYLPMGGPGRVEEGGVALSRLRAPPAGGHPYAPLRALPALEPGAAVEVQWRGGRSHPFGLWLGTVRSVERRRPRLRQWWGGGGGHDEQDETEEGPITGVRVTFDQYPSTSAWREVHVELPAERSIVALDDEDSEDDDESNNQQRRRLALRRRRRRQRRRDAAAAAVAASTSNPIYGLIGGVRVLSAGERAQWASVRRRQQAAPPAAVAVAAAAAAAATEE
jgi:hypothetical protein